MKTVDLIRERRWSDLWDHFCMQIAWWIPRNIAKWCYVRVATADRNWTPETPSYKPLQDWK